MRRSLDAMKLSIPVVALGAAALLVTGCDPTSDAPSGGGAQEHGTVVTETSPESGGEAAAPENVKAQIILDDIRTAVWMVTDNGYIDDDARSDSFVCDSADLGGATPGDEDMFGPCKTSYAEDEYRPGILFQTGTVVDPGGNYDHFEAVELKMADGRTITVAEDDFDWLDINGAGTTCPLDPLHAYMLFYDDQDNWPPTPVDLQVCTKCEKATVSSGCACTTQPCDVSECLRGRALHAGLRPNKDIVTYWPDPGSLYEMRVALTTQGSHTLTEYTFDLFHDITVDRWNEGCFKERYEGVTTVRLVYTDDHSAQHGGYHTPAMNGGKPERS